MPFIPFSLMTLNLLFFSVWVLPLSSFLLFPAAFLWFTLPFIFSPLSSIKCFSLSSFKFFQLSSFKFTLLAFKFSSLSSFKFSHHYLPHHHLNSLHHHSSNSSHRYSSNSLHRHSSDSPHCDLSKSPLRYSSFYLNHCYYHCPCPFHYSYLYM